MKLSEDQVYQIERLASLIATARVRRYAFKCGLAPNETQEGVNRRVLDAEDELRQYLEDLEVQS